MEIWKDIPGYEGAYQVSNLGRVKSIKFKKERILKGGCNNTGYPIAALCLNGVKRDFLIHRLVTQAFIKNPENKKTVNHINGIKADNRVINLEWNTYKENLTHARKTGLINYKKRRKLNEFQVLTILTLRDKTGPRELGRMFKVGHGSIISILKGEGYKETTKGLI